ncbi:MAG: TIM barrel protein [Planctomycetia bacterium]|nr:TIM barrel protein [Planctomycetia bacterium]
MNQEADFMERVRVMGMVVILFLCGAVPWGSAQEHTDVAESAEAEVKARRAAAAEKLFAKENLAAWCIVPFDSQKRTPQQRAEMLEGLGLTKEVYDWRDNHIPEFDDELNQLTKRNIELTGFWLVCGLDPANEHYSKLIVEFLQRRNVRGCQLWVLVGGFEGITDEDERIEKIATGIAWLADEMKKIDGSVLLYNHGGWFGEPENMIRIIEASNRRNVGITYNFHHAHHRIADFEPMLRNMLPYLRNLSLNGMDVDGAAKGRMILPIGTGECDRDLLRMVCDSGYEGMISILCHVDADAEQILRGNMEGLEKIRQEIIADRDD